MPAASTASSGSAAATRARAGGATINGGKTGPTQHQIHVNNQRFGLAFRKRVNEMHRKATKAAPQVISDYSVVTASGVQTTFQVIADPVTGEQSFVTMMSPTKNIPRVLRAKRTHTEAQIDDDDEQGQLERDEDDEEMDQGGREAFWTAEQHANSKQHKKQRKMAGEARVKKASKKSSSSSPSSKKAAPAARGEDNARPASATSSARDNEHVDMAEAAANDVRRSSRRNAAAAPPSSSSAATNNAREPPIREDEAENHVSSSARQPVPLNEHNLRRSTRAGSAASAEDALAGLSDRMGLFDIKSEAGSESTRVFSRESSLYEPQASTWRM